MTAAMNTLKKNDSSNKCDKCNVKIHANFIGYHKCGYANCSICKNAITNSGYWNHIRSHPGHENDGAPLPPRTTFGNRQRYGGSSRYDRGSRSLNRDSADAIQQLKVGEEYEVNITQIGSHGDGIARIRGCVIFVRGGHIGEQVNITITKTGSRFAIAT